jgi:Phytanoyl-CoA dioxygenase (PhyH)
MKWSAELATRSFAIRHDEFPSDRRTRTLADDPRTSPMRSKAALRQAMRVGSVRGIAPSRQLRDWAREVLGPHAFAFRATLLGKSPNSNWLVVWHPDTALPMRRRIDVTGWALWSTKQGIAYAHAPHSVLSRVHALRVHLDDSTPENGLLRVLPQTHKLGLSGDDRIHEVAGQMAPVECPVSKSSVVGMRPRLAPASSKSRSEMRRNSSAHRIRCSPSIAAPLELAMA